MNNPESIIKNERILHAFEAGLDSFAQGDFVQAEKYWREVLEIDPENELALDYIHALEEEIPFEDKRVVYKELLEEAIRLIGKNQLEPAYELLQMVLQNDPDNERAQKFLDTTKGLLLKDYLAEIGDTDFIVKIKKNMQDIMKINLTRESAYILSMVDGNLSIEELFTLAGIDRFLFMRNLAMLLRNDIVTFVDSRR
ncbi:MAG: tetratricopeptide repeat protein [bacterium]